MSDSPQGAGAQPQAPGAPMSAPSPTPPTATADPGARPGPPVAHPPLQGGSLLVGTFALATATFMNVLDSSIANVSLPAISGNLGVSPIQGTWVITSFAVANAISVPLTGWLTQRFGAVRMFTGAVVLFVLASWLCGMATSIEMLIAFRVLQGLVAGPMIPLSQTLLMSSYPPAKVGMALALWAMTTLVAPVVGPVLGGWITDNFSWPWIFYINVPIGLIAAAATWSVYRHRETPIRKLPIDTVGLTLLVVWVGALQIMLDKGKELDWFESNQIILLAIVAAVGFCFFIAWELTEAHPVVELRLFKGRNFSFATATLSLAYCLFIGNVVLLPLWLQQWMGYSATAAGWTIAPVGLFAILLSPVVGKNVARVDPRVFSTFSFTVFALVLWMRSHFTPQVDNWTVVLPTLIQGVSLAAFFIPLTTIVMSGMTPDRIPSAAGLSNFVRITAGAFGTSITTTLWENRASMHHAHITEQLNSSNATFQQTLAQLAAAGYSPEQALAVVNRTLDQQAFTRGADDIFLLSTWLFLGLIGLVWCTRPTPPKMGAPGAKADAGGAH